MSFLFYLKLKILGECKMNYRELNILIRLVGNKTLKQLKIEEIIKAKELGKSEI